VALEFPERNPRGNGLTACRAHSVVSGQTFAWRPAADLHLDRQLVNITARAPDCQRDTSRAQSTNVNVRYRNRKPYDTTADLRTDYVENLRRLIDVGGGAGFSRSKSRSLAVPPLHLIAEGPLSEFGAQGTRFAIA
jgi:hypothetical protein